MRNLHPCPTFPLNLEPPAARSLSLLFILQEWLFSEEKLRQFKNQSHAISASSVAEHLEIFLLFSLANSFPKKRGASLDKICFYCDILLQASKVPGGSIRMILEEMYQSILAFKRALPMPKKMQISTEQIQDLVHLLGDKLSTFFSALIPFLQEARTDENILIYLVEHKHKFNDFLGARFIEEILQRFFPSGHSHLRAVICEGFTRRGFTSFLADKESLIEELEWGAPCHLPAPAR